MVPVGLQADGAEDMSTWDGHRVPEVLLTEEACVLLKRHGENVGVPSNSVKMQ